MSFFFILISLPLGHDKLIISFASNGDFQDALSVLVSKQIEMRGLS